MASTDVTELVENALQSENDELFKTICCDFTKKLQSCCFLVGQEFSAQIGKTLHRDIDAEAYLPQYAKAVSGKNVKKRCIALR